MTSNSIKSCQYPKKEGNSLEEVRTPFEEILYHDHLSQFMSTRPVSTPSTVDLTSISNGSSSSYGTESSHREYSCFTNLELTQKQSLQRRLAFDEYKSNIGADIDEMQNTSVSSDSFWSWKENTFDSPIRPTHERKSFIECNESPMSFLDTSLSSHASDASSHQTLSDVHHNITGSGRLRKSAFIFPYSRQKYMHKNADYGEGDTKSSRASSKTLLRVVTSLIILHTCFSIFLLVRLEQLPYKHTDGPWIHPLLGRQSGNILSRVGASDPHSSTSFKSQNSNIIFIKAVGGLAPLYSTNAQWNDRFGETFNRGRVGFQSLDRNMYSSIELRTRSVIHPRIMTFEDSGLNSIRSSPRILEIDKTPFTDNTQLYGMRDSDDQALSRMEPSTKDSDEDSECVSEPWHHEYQPSCNSFHELDMIHIDDAQDGGHLTLFPKQGFWRNAWKVKFPYSKESAILKTPKYSHNFEAKFYETDRVDALAMSRLTFSPHVINIYSFCARSVMTELASNIRLGTLADKARKIPFRRLRIAADLAQGLVDVHFGKTGSDAKFVHLDINPNNVVVSGSRLKINDFNIGVMLKRNSTSGIRCTFPTPPYPNAQWRSPEEVDNSIELTEKVDVFSMGHIFYRILVGHEPWNYAEPGGKPSRTKLIDNVKTGKLPYIPKEIKESKDQETQAIYTAMMMCYTIRASDRPSSHDVARFLRNQLQILESKTQSNRK
jgi:hypothetical protein